MQQYIVHAWDGTDEQAQERRMNEIDQDGIFEANRQLCVCR